MRGIDDGAGKSWRAVECQGREGFDKKALASDHPELAAKYTKRGAPYSTFRWVKAS